MYIGSEPVELSSSITSLSSYHRFKSALLYFTDYSLKYRTNKIVNCNFFKGSLFYSIPFHSINSWIFGIRIMSSYKIKAAHSMVNRPHIPFISHVREKVRPRNRYPWLREQRDQSSYRRSSLRGNAIRRVYVAKRARVLHTHTHRHTAAWIQETRRNLAYSRVPR